MKPFLRIEWKSGATKYPDQTPMDARGFGSRCFVLKLLQYTMSTALATATTTTSPILSVVNNYLATVKTSKGTPPDEATKQNFINQCVAYELNPIKRQAYLTGYDSNGGAKFTFIVGIDGFTTIASRTGAYAGKDQARFTYSDNQLDSASVTVYRLVQGQKCAFTGQAYFDEYKQPSPLWTKMPKTMLEKCAFAKALRSAFPESLSGLYTDDEINTKERELIEIEVLDSILRIIQEISQLKNTPEKTITDFWAAHYQVTDLVELTPAQGKQCLKALDKKLSDLKTVEVETVEQDQAKLPILGTNPLTEV